MPQNVRRGPVFTNDGPKVNFSERGPGSGGAFLFFYKECWNFLESQGESNGKFFWIPRVASGFSSSEALKTQQIPYS